MATPRVGADGHRRLTVTVTLLDDEADLLWAVAYLRTGNASTGCSQVAKTILREHLALTASDPDVHAAVGLLRDARPSGQYRRLTAIPDLPS